MRLCADCTMIIDHCELFQAYIRNLDSFPRTQRAISDLHAQRIDRELLGPPSVSGCISRRSGGRFYAVRVPSAGPGNDFGPSLVLYAGSNHSNRPGPRGGPLVTGWLAGGRAAWHADPGVAGFLRQWRRREQWQSGKPASLYWRWERAQWATRSPILGPGYRRDFFGWKYFRNRTQDDLRSSNG